MALDILLVDDEPGVRLAVGDRLEQAGHQVTRRGDGRVALETIEAHNFDLVVCDILLPGVSGLKVFRQLRAKSPDTDVILITAQGSVEDAVKALKEGASDYLTKPFEVDILVHDIARIEERRSLQRELRDARRALAGRPERPLLGRSTAMKRVFDRVETIAQSDAAVLVQGESGTGKELVARMLHDGGPRRDKPFIPINCAAFPDTLIEAELFGHERGAFTGATARREGRFAAAHGGTLFLDEVAELPLPAQAKLLRVLQEGSFEPLGSNRSVKVDVRVVSATHRDLRARAGDGRFREDLLYRLKVLHIRLPPLRDRRDDMPILVEHFLRRFGNVDAPPTISARAWAVLSQYRFPGNVRELEHAIHHAVVLARGSVVEVHHLPEEIGGALAMEDVDAVSRPDANGFQRLAAAAAEFEREYLARALTHTAGNRAQAAALLGISRKNLWEKLRKHGLGRGAGDGPPPPEDAG